MRLTQELRGASTGAKGGAAAAERLKKELEKTRCASGISDPYSTNFKTDDPIASMLLVVGGLS